MSNYLRNDAGELVLDANGDPQLTPEARSQLDQQSSQASTLAEQRDQAIEAYRAAAAAANPHVPPRLIAGATVEEINASVEQAQTLVSEIKDLQPAASTDKPAVGFSRPGATSRGDERPAPTTSWDKILRGVEEARKGWQ